MEIDYLDLAHCTGLDVNTIYQHHFRGKFDGKKLESIVIYLAKHANDWLRHQIIESAIMRDNETKVGLIPPSRKKRKSA